MAAVSKYPFTTPRSKKVKRHSLKPQIFLQLELSSPKSRNIDPSNVGVLNDGWRDDPSNFTDGSDHFETHVRLEHCNTLPAKKHIRNENLNTCDAFLAADLAEEFGASSNEEYMRQPNLSPSPTSVKAFGRHDHLLDPLPNELFHDQGSTEITIPSTISDCSDHAKPTTTRSVVTRRSSNGEEIVDVRGSSLDLFAMIDFDNDEKKKDEATVKEETKPKRKSTKRNSLQRTQSLSRIEQAKRKQDGPVKPRRNGRQSIGAESRRPRPKSGAGTNSLAARSFHEEKPKSQSSGWHEEKPKSKSSGRRKSCSGSPSGTARLHRSQGDSSKNKVRPTASEQKSKVKRRSEPLATPGLSISTLVTVL